MKQKFYCVLVVAALLCSMATFVKAELPVKTTWEASDTTAVLQDGKFAFAPLDLTNATPFKGSASGDTFSTNANGPKIANSNDGQRIAWGMCIVWFNTKTGKVETNGNSTDAFFAKVSADLFDKLNTPEIKLVAHESTLGYISFSLTPDNGNQVGNYYYYIIPKDIPGHNYDQFFLFGLDYKSAITPEPTFIVNVKFEKRFADGNSVGSFWNGQFTFNVYNSVDPENPVVSGVETRAESENGPSFASFNLPEDTLAHLMKGSPYTIKENTDKDKLPLGFKGGNNELTFKIVDDGNGKPAVQLDADGAVINTAVQCTNDLYLYLHFQGTGLAQSGSKTLVMRDNTGKITSYTADGKNWFQYVSLATLSRTNSLKFDIIGGADYKNLGTATVRLDVVNGQYVIYVDIAGITYASDFQVWIGGKNIVGNTATYKSKYVPKVEPGTAYTLIIPSTISTKDMDGNDKTKWSFDLSQFLDSK